MCMVVKWHSEKSNPLTDAGYVWHDSGLISSESFGALSRPGWDSE